jgi:MoaA/NifB/PqqE/SkfB family radical SAM enzyme/GT2 family glycosyltransferase
MNRTSLPRHASLVRSWREDRPARGFSVTLEVAFRCNVRCVFCSRWSDPTDLRLDAIREVAEDMAALGASYVSITGGDPFVRSDIREIIDAFVERAVPIHLNTNGVLLRKYADFLKSRAASFRGITVSIDSPVDHVHDEIRGAEGTFRRAMKGIEAIREAIPVALACTLNHKNLHQIEDYHRFARQHALPYRFQPLHDDGANLLSPNQEGVTVLAEELDGLTRRLESTLAPRDGYDKRLYYRLFEPFFRAPRELNALRCVTAARLIYFIDPSGNVFPCDTRRDVPLGNVYEERFRAIAAGARSTAWRGTCRKHENGCWCMYACVTPDNLRYQDLPLRPVTRGGLPVRRRWERRLAALAGAGAQGAPAPRGGSAAPAPADWPFTSIVVASFNGGPFLLRNLQALLALDYPTERREIVLVDDGSDDGSIDRARSEFAAEIARGSLRIVAHATPLGVPAAYNRGVREANPAAEFILKSDNDLLPQPDALRELVRHALANPRAGILGGRIHLHGDPSRLHFLGGNLRSPLRGPARLHTPPQLLERPEQAGPAYLDVINSCMALVRREVFERAGLWPEFYGRYEYEDYDFAFQARRFGYLSLYCPSAVGYHAVSLTSAGRELSELRVRQRARNGVLFLARHAPRGWLASFLLYHLAKVPLDALRHGRSPRLALAGYLDGWRAARAGDLACETLPARQAPAAERLYSIAPDAGPAPARAR